MNSKEQTARHFFFGLLLVAAVLLALVVRPIAGALLMAAALAGALGPVHARLLGRLRGRRGLAAFVLVAALLVVLLGPLVTFAGFLGRESSEALAFVAVTARSPAVAELIKKLPGGLQPAATDGIAGLVDVNHTVAAHLAGDAAQASSTLLSAVVATGSAVLGIAAMLIALYFLLAEGDALVAWLDAISPLRAGQTRELLSQFRKVSFSVLVSTVISAGVQALTALLGYALTGVPHPVFFVAITFVAAFIPAIGAGVVCIVTAGLLYASGHGSAAVFLALWGLVVVGLVDYVVKPLLIRAGMELRGAVVFFSLIGGFRAFGAIGLLLGPLTAALALALVRMYVRDFGPSAVAPVAQKGAA